MTKKLFVLECFIFLLGIVLVSFIPLNHIIMYGSLVLLSVYILFSIRFNKLVLSDLGFSKITAKAFFFWLLVSLGMVVGVLFLKFFIPNTTFGGISKTLSETVQLLPVYCLGAYFQELIFRGYLFARTEKVYGKKIAVVANILLFTLFHLPFLIQFKSLILLYSMIGGVIWTFLYAKYPNIILAGTSHAIVGSLTIVLLRRY